MNTKKNIGVLGLLGLVIMIQLLTHWTGTQYYLTQLTMSAYYSLVILGLCVLMGYAGQISLGHAGFFAIGGYLAAALTTHDLTPYSNTLIIQVLNRCGLLIQGQDIYGDVLLYFNPWVSCILAISAAALTALVTGIPVLKLKGHYLAMATLGFGTIIYRIVLASAFFGEADGISDVPPFTLVSGIPGLPVIEVSGDFSGRVQNYYIAWSMVIAGTLLLLNLIDSRVGRALRSIHGSEETADAMGINTARYKLKTFILSAIFAAAAGVFLTHFNGGIGPSEAGIMKSVRYVAIVAVGGMANIWGALTMGVLLNFLSLRGIFGTYDDAVFGLILILIMLFAPEGILSIRIRQRLRNAFSSSTSEIRGGESS
ncbi:MAG TPA: branched-chain amino acid ABC transporter permease [Thermodesulfobacteriaceae bacterium]|nr:branched-chain amino acid ABC transporter permease [Thermodesulfobacteriaceae bacterium]